MMDVVIDLFKYTTRYASIYAWELNQIWKLYITTKDSYFHHQWQKHPVLCVVCVYVFKQYTECQEYHCSMIGYLTIEGGFIFLMVEFQPHSGGIIKTIRLWVPIGLFNIKHACTEAGDQTVHAYMQLLSDTTPK